MKKITLQQLILIKLGKIIFMPLLNNKFKRISYQSSIVVLLISLTIFSPFMQKTAKAAELSSLTVLLDWYLNPDHAPLIIAKQAGYFERNGLEVELVAPSDPSAPPKLVAAGQGDIAISYQPQLYLQVAAGLKLARIGTLVSTPLNCLMVLKDSDIHSLKDLKDKKVGFSVAGMEDVLLNTMLQTQGLGLKDVELINVNFALTSALASKQVDAVIGAFRNFEPTLLKLAGEEGRCYFVEEHGVPIYDELIYVVKQDRVNDPILLKFMDAIEEATAFMINHPAEAMDIQIAYDKTLDDVVNRQAFEDTLPRFSSSPSAIDTRRYQRFADYMLESGMVKSLPPLSEYNIELIE